MAWNPQMYYPYQPYQPLQNPQQFQNQPQARSVEVVAVNGEQAVLDFFVPVGVTQMFVATDDSFVAFKTNGANGQGGVTFYDKRPPAPVQPPFDPTAYVTKEELESRLAALAAPKKGKKENEE